MMLEATQPAQAATDRKLTPFGRHILEGLSRRQKATSAQWLYDAAGSQLFEQITKLDEYYPTRTEIGILRANMGSMAEKIGSGRLLIEFGSGSSVKTEILLESLKAPAAYVAIDISKSILEVARKRLVQNFPDIPIRTAVGDFTRLEDMPRGLPEGPRLLFFPGSTIGNFDRQHALHLLRRFAGLLGSDGKLLIGADLQKSLDVLLPAYDDARGVTALFNLNLLVRINRELGADFDVNLFRHEARYNSEDARIEMHLVSTQDQIVHVLGKPIPFAKGESIHTENSYKFTVDDFCELAASAGLSTRGFWTDEKRYFGIFLLSRPETTSAGMRGARITGRAT